MQGGERNKQWPENDDVEISSVDLAINTQVQQLMDRHQHQYLMATAMDMAMASGGQQKFNTTLAKKIADDSSYKHK